MNIAIQRAAIIGATGPTGRHLTSELRRRGVLVRAVSRSRDHLDRCFPETEVEKTEADALDAAALRTAVAGCDLVADCIGLPPDRMQDHARAARKVAAAAAEVSARCLQVSSFWSFLPVQQLPLTEAHPREGGNRYAQARREAEDVMLAAGAAVVHLPDFFGPAVHTSTLQRPLEEAAAGKAMTWIGSGDTEREWVYVPDAMAMVADLVLRQEAYGTSWIVPGSGPLTGKRVAEIAAVHLGRQVKLRETPRWLLRGASLVVPDLRALRPILDDYLQPIAFDASRLQRLLGQVRVTPYEEAIPATLDAIRAAEAAR